MQRQKFNGLNLGSTVTSTNGQEDLCSRYSSNTNNGPSINKEMWVFFDTAQVGTSRQNLWIEAGAKKGAVAKSLQDQVNQIFWQGHFIGYYLPDDSGNTYFYNTPYGAGGSTGTHTYEIKQIAVDNVQGYATWAVFVSGVRALTIPIKIRYTSAIGSLIGIENKDSFNGFKSGTFMSSWKYVSTSNALTTINSPINADKDFLGYRSTFSSGKVSLTNSKSCPIALASLHPSILFAFRPAESSQFLAQNKSELNRPEPTRKANKHLSREKFISEVEAIGTIPPNAKLISAKLVTWSDYEADEFQGANFTDVSKDRMVWVVKLAFPQGVDTEAGFFDNARQTLVIDAETKETIVYGVTGKARGSKDFGLKPNPFEPQKFPEPKK
jgi:hypothetical protein